VIVNRGRRRHQRNVLDEVVALDGNVMTRRTFLQAVAVATGRATLSDIETEDLHNSSAVAPTREQALRQHRLILVAEDNETNQRVIKQQFSLLGVTADITSNGRDALKRWQGTEYAMLFTDLHMPEMDGYDLAVAIRTLEKGERHVPIVALTANALKGEAERCRAAGMDDYLHKPAQLIELKAALEKWLPPLETSTDAPPASVLQPRSSATTALDISVLEALVGNDPEIIREFLEEFRNTSLQTATELKIACQHGQTSQASALGHKLKSSSRAVGAIALGDLCAELEYAGNHNQAGQLTALLGAFELELTAVKQALDVLLPDSPAGASGESADGDLRG
jgi:CheY-like chemotaxis protein/HPt (histidine-containing phosphotransfer) domain-containing protein